MKNFVKNYEPIPKRSTNLFGQSLSMLKALMLGKSVEKRKAAEIEAQIQPCPDSGNGRGRFNQVGAFKPVSDSRRALRNLKRMRKLMGYGY